MKNLNSPIEENDLDNLLRQLLLDGGDDEFTQNTLTMNADFIFKSEMNVAPNATHEIALIQKLEQAFIKPRGLGKFWLNGIVLIGLIVGSFVIYKMNSGKDSFAVQNQNNQKNKIAAIISSTDTSENNQTPTTISVSQIFPAEIIPDSVSDIDTLSVQKTNPTEKSGKSNDIIPIERNWLPGNYVVNVPGPVFPAKASPENYKLKQGYFTVEVQNVMFGCKQDSFLSSYYVGEPFKSGMGDLQYFNLGAYARNGDKKRWLPWSILEYSDTNQVKVETRHDIVQNQQKSNTSIVLYQLPEKGIQLALEPFYFRKFEVTNKEYREFLNWVRASNGFANKPICTYRIDTLPVTNDQGGEEITVKGKKYLLHRTIISSEDYKKVYNYVFFNQSSDVLKQLGKNSLYVYPDTASWTKDFAFSFNEPMTNYYFCHPAYDNYPVVGVSWFQAMAFLDWKTYMHQKQLDAENIPYEIEYTLPSDIEWELASSSMLLGKNIEYISYYSATQDWMTNLGLSYSGQDDPYQRPNYLKNLFTKDEYFRGDYIADGYFHTALADLSHGKGLDKDMNTKHLGPLGISWMDGNVSEWMAENYSENWKPFFQKHLLVLDADTSESTKLAKQIEMLYDKGNAQNGKLVRGANWYDERFGGKPGSERNEAGINPKRYVNPSEQHSTVGFRYVIHVKRK